MNFATIMWVVNSIIIALVVYILSKLVREFKTLLNIVGGLKFRVFEHELFYMKIDSPQDILLGKMEQLDQILRRVEAIDKKIENSINEFEKLENRCKQKGTAYGSILFCKIKWKGNLRNEVRKCL